MGLDMYLYKTKRVKDYTAEDYSDVEDAVSEFSSVEDLKEKVSSIGLKKVGYWRKANQIHSWFVENCQSGIDECQMEEVTKQNIEELLIICLDIIKNKDDEELAKSELPTQNGFFFGSTEYDSDYYEDIKDTIKIIQNVLNTTDFEKEVVLYRSSW